MGGNDKSIWETSKGLLQRPGLEPSLEGSQGKHEAEVWGAACQAWGPVRAKEWRWEMEASVAGLSSNGEGNHVKTRKVGRSFRAK